MQLCEKAIMKILRRKNGVRRRVHFRLKPHVPLKRCGILLHYKTSPVSSQHENVVWSIWSSALFVHKNVYRNACVHTYWLMPRYEAWLHVYRSCCVSWLSSSPLPVWWTVLDEKLSRPRVGEEVGVAKPHEAWKNKQQRQGHCCHHTGLIVSTWKKPHINVRAGGN